MATDAPRHGLSGSHLLEVAQVAGDLGHRKVTTFVSLDDLRVTAGAAKLLSSAEFPKVLCVVEPDHHIPVAETLIVHHPFEVPEGVASRSQTRSVLDFCPGLGPVSPRDILHHLIGCLQLAHRLGFDARCVMALDAFDVVV